MDSPFPPSASSPGDGRIVATLLPAGGSGLETMTYQYPLKLISPTPTLAQPSVLVFLLSYGGGLVGGDCVNLTIRVKAGAKLSIATQGHTKIFKSPSPDITTRQSLHVQIENGAGLCLLPDPVQPFEKSVYSQVQIFKLESQASLCMLDWVTQGRSARGEDWSFVQWSGRNEIWLSSPESPPKDRLLVRDSVLLSQEGSKTVGGSLQGMMHGLGVTGTLILRGPAMASLGDFFLGEFSKVPRIGSRDFRSPEAQKESAETLSDLERWRSQRLDRERLGGVLWSAAHVRGCVVVKFGANNFEPGREWIGSMIAKEGSIAKLYGDQALLCIR